MKCFSAEACSSASRSPPSRRRGLKSLMTEPALSNNDVASFAEAWIEIRKQNRNQNRWKNVASFAEAWIEIIYTCRKTGKKWSPPSRRRGLKLV